MASGSYKKTIVMTEKRPGYISNNQFEISRTTNSKYPSGFRWRAWNSYSDARGSEVNCNTREEAIAAIEKMARANVKVVVQHQEERSMTTTDKLRSLLEDIRNDVELTEAKGMPGTVTNFLLVLSSKITDYDRKEQAKEMKRRMVPNVYRLGLLFQAADKVKQDMTGMEQSSDKAALEKLKASLNQRFTSDFGPKKNVVKQIDAFLEKGKLPSIVAK